MDAGNLLEGSNMGTAGSGLLALDYVFPETALFWRAIPEMYFGMSVSTDNVLQLSPNLSADLSWFKNENLKYSGLIYDLTAGNDFVQINNVRGTITDEKVCVTFEKPEGEFKVYVDGKELSSSGYKVSGTKIEITVDFGACKIEVR